MKKMNKKICDKNNGISLITLVITIVVIVILAATITLAVGKNNPINQADKAVFNQDTKVIQEMLNDEIAKITLENSMPPEIYLDDEYRNKLSDTSKSKLRINYNSKLINTGFLHYMINDKKYCIVIGKKSNVESVLNNFEENSDITYSYTEQELPSCDENTIPFWYVNKTNDVTVELKNKDRLNPKISNVSITASNVKDYLGKKVTYTANDSDTLTWRLFYIDYATDKYPNGKYGDGIGTIYLKADCYQNIDTDEGLSPELKDLKDVDYSLSSDTKMKEMNPLWYSNRKNATTLNKNEKASSFFLDINRWKEYKNDSALYAIGAPSVEMYIDSYNLKHTDSDLSYTYGSTGYLYAQGSNTPEPETTRNFISLDEPMYSATQKRAIWWLASPSAIWDSTEILCGVQVFDLYLGVIGASYSRFLSPVVAIPVDVESLQFDE